MNSKTILLIGIGNNGRRDDGLGWAFLESIEQKGHFDGDIHYCYQLQIEDAERISRVEQVVFVDAYQGHLEEGYEWVTCRPSGNFTFTTHAFTPSSILYLCQELYKKLPVANILMIQGQEWGLGKGLSERARINLQKALSCFNEKMVSEII